MDYEKMSDEELAEARIELDKQIQVLRAEKKKIQDVIDSRYTPPVAKSGDHTIGFD